MDGVRVMAVACFVYVEWIDSSRLEGWTNRAEVEDLARARNGLACSSVGLLIEETADRIVVATSQDEAKNVLSAIVIPRAAIKRIKKRTVASVFGRPRKEAK